MKEQKMKKIKNILWVSLGVVALPIVYMLFCLDRILHCIIFWKEHVPLSKWSTIRGIQSGIIKFICVLTIYLLFTLL
jgi:hypothetical protein